MQVEEGESRAATNVVALGLPSAVSALAYFGAVRQTDRVLACFTGPQEGRLVTQTAIVDFIAANGRVIGSGGQASVVSGASSNPRRAFVILSSHTHVPIRDKLLRGAHPLACARLACAWAGRRRVVT